MYTIRDREARVSRPTSMPNLPATVLTSAATSDPSAGPVVDIRSASKNYGSTLALSGVNLALYAGRIHALMGENGAGKTSLVKILVGATSTSAGSIFVAGKPAQFRSVADAIAAGIVPIYQHLTLFPQLSVLENLFSFAAATPGYRAAHLQQGARQKALQSLARVGLRLDLDAQVETLTLGERQLIEIARGIQCDCKVLVLDEPTAALTSQEASRLMDVLRDLAAQGVALVYISHKSDEIRALADEVTVLRDGRSVIEGKNFAETNVEDLVEAMLGHDFAASQKSLPDIGAALLEAHDIVLPGGAPISLSVAAGEILGVVGLAGSGTEELGEVLAGVRKPVSGQLWLGGRELHCGARKAAVRAGIGFVPADRHADGLFPDLSVQANASASILPDVSRLGFLRKRRERQAVQPLLTEMALSPYDPAREVQYFSGGNQQKALLARNLGLTGLRAVVLCEPTRGIDVGARDKIHDAIVQAARAGAAVVLITSDLEELSSLVHRAVIIRRGVLTQHLPRSSTPDEIAIAMQSEE